jgi:hypothetical protein
VAHNGSLVPIPGRDIMVQGWYQGGISIFDWSNPDKPVEIAYHDRGPVSDSTLVSGGSWSVYWYNGTIVSSEIARGLDVFDMKPSQFVSQNEIDAAKTVIYAEFNAQGQPKIEWPPSFALARAYLDQLERNACLSAGRIATVRSGLAAAERANPAARQSTLTQLAREVSGEAAASCDANRVRTLSSAIGSLSTIS